MYKCIHTYIYIYTHTHTLMRVCIHTYVCCCFSVSRLCWTLCDPCTAACQASLSLTISWNLPNFMSIALLMPSSRLILWCLLLLPSIFPSIRDFSNELAVHIRWPKILELSFGISPSNEYSGLMLSLRIVWFDLLAIQGTFRILLQYHILKASTHTHMYIKKLNQLYTGK